MDGIFFELGVLMILAAILALLVRLLKQPLIPAYILAGFILAMTGVVKDPELVTSISELGVAFLLFIVGLEIDLKKLKPVLGVATVGTFIQFFITAGIAFGLSSIFGLDTLTSLYMGLVVGFSSTMVVIKLLSDKKQLDTLHGRIIVGVLLMQDFIAVIALSLLTGLDNLSGYVLLVSLLQGLVLFFVVIILTLYVFPKVFKFAAASQELLFLSAIAVCFLFSILFNQIGNFLVFIMTSFVEVPLNVIQMLSNGFSIAIGAFVAGLSLANLPYGVEIEAKIKPLKDFFSILFFISLGMGLELSGLGRFIPLFFLFLVLVIIIKPLLIILSCSLFGYKKKPSFLSGLYLGQTSEFGLIIAALGLSLGHIDSAAYSFAILLAVFTIGFTSYFDKFEFIYTKFHHVFTFIDKLPSTRTDVDYVPMKKLNTEAILIGYDRIGYSILNKLKEMKKNFMVVDYNPEVIKTLAENKIHCIYGDYGDKEVLEKLDFESANYAISTPPDFQSNLHFVKYAKARNPDIVVFTTADRPDDALKLYDHGADYVILPHFIGGEHLSFIMDETSDLSPSRIITRKLRHVKELHHRRSLGHFKKRHSK